MQRSLLPWVLACGVIVLAAIALVRVVDSGEDAGSTEHADARDVEAETVELSEVDREGPQRAASAPDSTMSETRAVHGSHTIFVEAPPPPPPVGRIAVRVVRDEDGLPIAGAVVSLGAGMPGGEGDVTTDAEGRAEFLHLENYLWTVNAEFDGRIAGSAGANLTRLQPNASVELRLARRRAITARIVDSGGAPFDPQALGIERAEQSSLSLAIGAHCQSIGANFDARDAPAYRSRAGHPRSAPFTWTLEFPDQPTGCVHIVFGEVVVGRSEFDPWADEVRIAIDPRAVEEAKARLVLRVVHEIGGVPVPDARVLVRRPHGEDREARTDAAGRAEFVSLVAASLTVTVEARGHASKTTRIERPFPSEVLVMLGRGRVVEGVLLDQNGGVRAGKSVAIHDAAGAGGVPQVRVLATRTTDAAGRFRFEDLPPGRYAVGLDNGTPSRRLPSTNRWGEDLKLADCMQLDALGLVVRTYDPKVDPKYIEVRGKSPDLEGW